MNNTLKKGFTLVELIIVIAIIAVLASLAFMALSGETAQARDSKRLADIKVVEDAIATSNGKNKKINYNVDTEGKQSDGSARTDTVADELETSTGIIQAIRGANLVPVIDGLLDSDVLPTAAKDPKGSHYFTTFLSSTDYSVYGTKENPNTKIPTAVVRGTFKNGSILDVLTSASSSSGGTITVASPGRFVRGDVIKVDDEYMVVTERDTALTSNNLTVARGYLVTGAGDGAGTSAATQAVHNRGASVKIITPAAGGASLICLGAVANTGAIIVDAIVSTNSGRDAMGGTPNAVFVLAAASAAAKAGKVCDATNGNAIVEEGLYLPYKIN